VGAQASDDSGPAQRDPAELKQRLTNVRPVGNWHVENLLCGTNQYQREEIRPEMSM
jgi:hypothetical protein